MKNASLTLAALALLCACDSSGSNPITGARDNVADPASLDPNISNATRYAFDFDAGYTMNSLTYDPATDELIINNLPFDSETGTYVRRAVLPNGFAIYENDQAAEVGFADYLAVVRQSDSGFTLVGAVGTSDYINDSYAGATTQRLSTSSTLPTTGQISYTGDYTAVRASLDGGGSAATRVVTGTSNFRLDFEDFDGTGAAGGTISNRLLFFPDGTPVLDGTGNQVRLDGIGFRDSVLDRATGLIAEQDASNGDASLSGTYNAMVTGPNAEEVAGYVLLTGTEAATGDLNVQETGVFIATQN